MRKQIEGHSHINNATHKWKQTPKTNYQKLKMIGRKSKWRKQTLKKQRKHKTNAPIWSKEKENIKQGEMQTKGKNTK